MATGWGYLNAGLWSDLGWWERKCEGAGLAAFAYGCGFGWAIEEVGLCARLYIVAAFLRDTPFHRYGLDECYVGDKKR